jgi:hypothetical protein
LKSSFAELIQLSTAYEKPKKSANEIEMTLGLPRLPSRAAEVRQDSAFAYGLFNYGVAEIW